MNSRHFFVITLVVALIVIGLGAGAFVRAGSRTSSPAAQLQSDSTLDRELRSTLAAHDITSLDPGPTPDPAKVELGKTTSC
ncbi:MAG: hypothetical protein KDI03_09390 [Anaerolineae bacterium]|nr:hypothetical protein [Anaerolineae bacterium]